MADTAQLSIRYGDTQLHFTRFEAKTSKQKLTIKVHSDCRIDVFAPIDSSDKDVIEGVTKRARWIYKQVSQFQEKLMHVTPRQFISGESHYYLGKQYMLKVVEDSLSKPKVKLLRGKLEVTVREKSASTVEAQLSRWYKKKADDVFQRQLERISHNVLWLEQLPPIKLQKMKKQWGSCSPKGTIILNPLLVKAPSRCIDYVILHELCHLVEHNHSEQFYRLLSQVMTNWQETKNQLDGLSERILN